MSAAPLRVPDADNAAIIYRQAFQHLCFAGWDKISRENSSYAFNRNQGWSFDAKDPALRPFLRAHAATIALLHKAASKPGCYFVSTTYYLPDVGYGMDFAELRGASEASALLLLDSCTKSAGRRPGAGRSKTSTPCSPFRAISVPSRY